jgi:hypothetical protein
VQPASRRARSPRYGRWITYAAARRRATRPGSIEQLLRRGLYPPVAAGHEVDLLVERAAELRALEIKSGRTIAADWLCGLEHFARLSGAPRGMLIYGGDQTQRRSGATIYGWRGADRGQRPLCGMRDKLEW